MSSIATLNGVQYIIPAYNDTGWAQGAGNLSLYLAAIAANTFQPSGGSFTLTAEADFGSSFGLKTLYIKSETANPSSTGVIRLAKTDSVKWRNNANGADIALTLDGSDNLTYNSTKVLLSGAVVNADINASAAIAYSKLALTGSIVNADISGSAAIAYSKLALTGAILNADLAGSIAYSKLSLTGAILNADLAGSIAYSKLSLTGAILNADLAGSIAYSKLSLTGSILNADINASAAIALSKLAALGTAKVVQTNASTGFLEASSVTNTELGYVSGVTSAIQTQLNAITTKVFQIVTATSTTQTLSTSSTYTAATNITATITPSSSTHKILVLVSGTAINTIANAITTFTIKRSGTDISSGGTGFCDFREQGTGNSYTPINIAVVDSPASTSALTYALFFKNNDNTSNCGMVGGSSSSITLIEVV
jgi:hypothetical protein